MAIELNGLKLHGYLRHRSFLDGMSNGGYEQFTQELYEKSLKPGMIVVDGGAHVGLYTLLAARRIGIDGRVFAFEPDPYNFGALVFNVNKNHSRNIVPIRKAVSNTNDDAVFYISGGTISSSLVNRKNAEECRQMLVRCATLDHELCNVALDSLLVKLDIEGAEPVALQGMNNLLQKVRSAVVIAELNPSALRDAGLSPRDMINELKSHGFQVYFIDELGKKLIPVASTTTMQKGNLYCVKEN
ncbi:MAG: FkbM family methyltransferase [Deltaproteobacteria bacterium]|nr:FkbM family methyltransferase [Deltaproteobacteria bacterium]